MLQVVNDGTCLWCGHGICAIPKKIDDGALGRLPRDLGAIERAGERPDPHLDNVVRLDRLRQRPAVLRRAA